MHEGRNAIVSIALIFGFHHSESAITRGHNHNHYKNINVLVAISNVEVRDKAPRDGN